ncbi:hypothetical protein ACFOQM_03245 [Paenibacillus sp. GCM10012307]|uniref:hypothetical protein n=1 Tax=Paenibacillus TaxID=44249 RepID=UPI001E28ABB0|nr:hypothetical protein [Paenibacillus roseus]
MYGYLIRLVNGAPGITQKELADKLCVTPSALFGMRNHPYDVGAAPYGSDEIVKPAPFQGNVFTTQFGLLVQR